MSTLKPQCGWPLCECPPYDGSDRCPKLGGNRARISTFEIGIAAWWHEKYAPFVEAEAMRRTVSQIRSLPEARR